MEAPQPLSPAALAENPLSFAWVQPGTDTPNDGTVGQNVPNWHDEIDIEILGRAPKATECSPTIQTPLIVQTNYFGKNTGGHEKVHCIEFGTYTYSFTWTANKITWSCVDSSGTVQFARTENRGTAPWPTQPGRVFTNMWANAGSTWAGTFFVPRCAQTCDFHRYQRTVSTDRRHPAPPVRLRLRKSLQPSNPTRGARVLFIEGDTTCRNLPTAIPRKSDY